MAREVKTIQIQHKGNTNIRPFVLIDEQQRCWVNYGTTPILNTQSALFKSKSVAHWATVLSTLDLTEDVMNIVLKVGANEGGVTVTAV